MRPADRAEMEASSGKDVVSTLHKSLGFSFVPGVAVAPDGRLMCMFGAVPYEIMGDRAAPWLIGTTVLTEFPTELMRGGRRYLTQVRQRYPKLVNYVDARNTDSVRWLRSAGFEIDPAEPFGVAGLPFHRFHVGFEQHV